MIYTLTLIFSLLGLINANNSGSGSSDNIDLSSGLSDDLSGDLSSGLSGDLSSGSGNYSGDSILEDKNTHYYIYIIIGGLIFLALIVLMVCKFTDHRSNIPIYYSRDRPRNIIENVEGGENVKGEIKKSLFSFTGNKIEESHV